MEFSPTNKEINRLIIEDDDTRGIISIWGGVGSGKTTMCFGAALSHLSQGKKVIYINTKSFFKLERFNQMKIAYPEFDIFNFLVYNPKNFLQQVKIIMDLEFLILKEINMLGKTNIGLIILDTATTLRQLDMKLEEYNRKNQMVMNSILATLDYLLDKYNIPVIITNRSIISFENSEDIPVERPSSARTMNYWVKLSIKIERTRKVGERIVLLEKYAGTRSKLKKITVTLTDRGFK
ncbi:MAG: hypothetical protein ACTSWY_06885 [Promethearchaeota archaeon]